MKYYHELFIGYLENFKFLILLLFKMLIGKEKLMIKIIIISNV